MNSENSDYFNERPMSLSERWQLARDASTLDIALNKPSPKKQKSTGVGVIVWLGLFGVFVLTLLTYLPGQFDQRYAGLGQVVIMVNPSGSNPDMDMQYSQINQNNAQANLINSGAYQRQSVTWMGWVFGFVIIGVLFVVFKKPTQ